MKYGTKVRGRLSVHKSSLRQAQVLYGYAISHAMLYVSSNLLNYCTTEGKIVLKRLAMGE